jgi:hypothetical protein
MIRLPAPALLVAHGCCAFARAVMCCCDVARVNGTEEGRHGTQERAGRFHRG